MPFLIVWWPHFKKKQVRSMLTLRFMEQDIPKILLNYIINMKTDATLIG